MNNHLLLLNRIKEIRNNFNFFLNKSYLDEINNAYLIILRAVKKKKKNLFLWQWRFRS
jgi:hypothetical protein